LDMLKRHQMCIDLKKNCLRIESDEISFLGESELPKMMEEVLEKEPKVEGPSGSTIGTETGTIMPGSSTAGSQGQSASTSGSTGQSHQITEESIGKVTELGFSRDEAVAALRQADGNVELAISLLL
jgi:DNA damage-inducible protein 1